MLIFLNFIKIIKNIKVYFQSGKILGIILFTPIFFDYLLRSITCRNIGGDIYLILDITQKCLTEEHIIIISTYLLPLIILIVFLINIITIYDMY